MGLKERVKKLVSDQLRPYLRSDVSPILNVSVSEISLVLPHLEFDAEALNRQAMESSPLLIKEDSMTVESVQLTFAPFRQPVLAILVQGWHADLEPRSAEDDWWEKKEEKTAEEKKIAALEALDPQGASAHAAAQALAEKKAGSSLIQQFLTSLMLTSVRLEFRGCSLRLVSHVHSGSQHICKIPLSSFEFGGSSYDKGSSWSGGLMGAFTTAFGGIWKKSKASISKYCIIQGLGLLVETQGVDGDGHGSKSEDSKQEYVSADIHDIAKQYLSGRSSVQHGGTKVSGAPDVSIKKVASHVVLFEDLVLGVRYTELAVDALEFEVPEAAVGLELQEVDALQILMSQIQGLARDAGNRAHARYLEAQRESDSGDAVHSGRNPTDLWKKGIQKAMLLSSHRRLSYTFQAGMSRSRYSRLYEKWLLELGWGQREDDGAERNRSKKKKDHLKKLAEEISEMQNKLPIEAIALGRRLARRRVSAARHSNESNAIRDANSMNQTARLRSFYSSFQEFMVSFWRIIVTATFLMQGKAMAVSMWVSAARSLGVSEWKSVSSMIWRSGNNENVVGLEDSQPVSGLESSSVTNDNRSYADDKPECVAPENYFQLGCLDEDYEIVAISTEKKRRWGMLYAFKIRKGSITLTCRAIKDHHNSEEPHSRSKGGESELESVLVPAVHFSWNGMVLAYGSTGTSSGTSISCGSLEAEIFAVIPSQLSQRLSANLDAEVFHKKFSSFGRWTSKKGDRALLLSSSPCPQKKNTGAQTIGEHPLAGEIYDKHWTWQERHIESWSRLWPKPGVAAEGMSSSPTPHLDEYDRPFLIAEFNYLDGEPSTDVCPGGLTKFSISLGQLDLSMKGSYFTSICQLLDQLKMSQAPTENKQTDSTIQPQSQRQPAVSLEKFWDDSYRKYLDTCRDTMVATIPKNSIFFSVVVDCPRFRLSATASELHEYTHESTNRDSSRRMLKHDFNTGATVVFDFGRIELAMWPPKKKEEAVVETPMQDIGRASTAPTDVWNNAVESKLWLKEPPASVHPDFAQRRDWEHEHVGSNMHICIEGVALTLELQKESLKELPMLGPLALVMESSLCWDQYSSLLRTSRSVSANVSGKILSLSVQSYVSEVTLVLQVFGFFVEIMKSRLGHDPIVVVEGGDSFQTVNAGSQEALALLSEDSNNSDLKPDSLSSGEVPFTACALTFSVELENFRLVLGDSRQGDGDTSGIKSVAGGKANMRQIVGLQEAPRVDDGHEWNQNPSSVVLGREVYVVIQEVSFKASLGDEENFCVLMGIEDTLIRLVNSGKVGSRSDLAKLRNDFFSASMSGRIFSSHSSGYKSFPGLVLAEVALEYCRVKAFGASAHESTEPEEKVIISDSTLEKQDLTEDDGTPNIRQEDSNAVDGPHLSSHLSETNVADLVHTADVDPTSMTVTLDSQQVEQLITEDQGSSENPNSIQFDEASSSSPTKGELYWLAADLEVSKVLVTDGLIDVLVAKVELVANGSENLHLNFGFERGLQRISVGVEGGLVLVHTAAVATLMQFSRDLGDLAAKPASLTTNASEAPQEASSYAVNMGSEDNREVRSLPSVYRSASAPALPTENRGKKFKRTFSAPPSIEKPVAERSEPLPGFDGVVCSKLAGFSLVLAKQNLANSEGVLFELEMSTTLEVGNSAKKATFDLIRFTILGLQVRSPVNSGKAPGRTYSRVPQFGASFKLGNGTNVQSLSGQPNDSLTQSSSIPEDASGTDIGAQPERQVSDQSLPDALSSSKEEQVVAGNIGLEGSNDGPQQQPASASEQAEGFHKSLSDFNSFILERLSVHFAIEKVSDQDKVWKWTNAWQGQCSIGGFNVAITTAEIQLLESLVAPLSGIGGSSKSNTGEGVPATARIEEVDEEGTPDFEIPDGSIIAIKDVYEHCYLAVEEIPLKKGQYHLTGVLHYTLAGDKALFKVKYQNAYAKNSLDKDSWFSLLSLHAKGTDGEPFCVHYRTGSGLADISPLKGGSWERWRFVPADVSQDGNSAEVDIQSPTYKHLFHLVNQKSKSGIAFQENVPVVVKQPGNPFKVKVFAKSPDRILESHEDLAQTKKASFPELTLGDQAAVDLVNSIPCVTCAFDTFIFTVLHEAAGGLHLLPLLRVRIPRTEGVIHIGLSKTRTILQCGIVLEHFESQSSRWESIVNPIETDLFYRSRSTRPEMAAMNDVKCPVGFFSRFRKVDLVFSEPSLDALLFLIGALDLAGPFALRYSPVQANRCLIRNHTGVDALCSFDEESSRRGGTIPPWHSDSFLMRHMTSRRETGPAKVASTVALYLQKLGTGVTSPVLLTLGDPGVFAIKTRLQTDAGKKTTGPMVVVDVSRRTEDGIFVTVSPMVRIQNASGLPLELKCRRDSQGAEAAVVVLDDGDTIDDSMGAFDALNLSGDVRKALSSLNLGNYILSVRPAADFEKSDNDDAQFDWCEDIKGATVSVQSSGVLDKFHYSFNSKVRGRNLESTFGVVFCAPKPHPSKKSSGPADQDAGLHFLIRTTCRQVPISRPKTEAEKDQQQGHYTPVAWQQQQEVLVLPTVRVLNLTTSNISVLLVSSSEHGKMRQNHQGKALQRDVNISSLGTESMYVDLGDLFLTVKQKDVDLLSKPICLGVGSKEFSKNSKNGKARSIEMEVDFGDGVHFALVNVGRGEDGVLEVMLLTRYTLQNDSHVNLLCCSAKQHSSWWGGLRRHKSQEPEWPREEGTVLTIAPKSRISWFERSTTVLFKRTEPLAEAALLDLESVSGSMEISLRVHCPDSVANRVQLGVQLKVPTAQDLKSSGIILLVPRYVVANDSSEAILVCQDGFQNTSETISLAPGESSALNAQELPGQNDNKGSEGDEEVGPDILLRVRFRPKEPGWNWSGPVNAAAIGSFSVKIRRPQQEDSTEKLLTTQKPQTEDCKLWFAVLDVQEKESSLIMSFRRQPADGIPYRIENALRSATITYNQEGLETSEFLEAGQSVGYVWDDLGEPHTLVVNLAGTALTDQINPDKLRSWKSIRASRGKMGLLHLPFLNDLSRLALYGDDGNEDDADLSTSQSNLPKIGYEVYADGPTRVVRICEEMDGRVEGSWQADVSRPKTEVEMRIPLFTISIVEPGKQPAEAEKEEGESTLNETVTYVPVICLRLTNVLIQARITSEYTFCQIKTERLDVDVKWQGAPLAAMVRGHGQDRFDTGHTVLHMAIVMSNTAQNPIQLKYASVLLQAIDLNLDEETMMKLVPFYRLSLSESTAPSRQIYFERFEIHPIKIVGSFLPGSPRADYSSGQETLRALLHSVIKVPTVRGATVELNGVLLSNALLTFKQLALKCAQHYSWYSMRAIYIARGSKLLPPGFASLFDDSAASSLDVFFDPASGSIDLQGLTIGMFGVLKRGLRKKGKGGGTQRYLGDLHHTVKAAGSNLIFAAVTEVSDSVLKGADANGFDGFLSGFRRGVLNVAMKPSVLRGAVVQGGSTRRIQLDRIVGANEAYIEGYLQAALDSLYKQSYVRVKVVDDQVLLKNLPPNTTLMEEMVQCARDFLIGEGLLEGESSVAALSSLRRLQGDDDRRLGPTVKALCEQLLVIIVVRSLRRQTITVLRQNNITIIGNDQPEILDSSKSEKEQPEEKPKEQRRQGFGGFFEGINFKRALGGFALSSALAYVDGRICRHIPNPLVRRVVSGFLLSFVE